MLRDCWPDLLLASIAGAFVCTVLAIYAPWVPL